MRESLLEILVDPVSKKALQLIPGKQVRDDIIEGVLRTADGREFIVRDGIPRFVDDAGGAQGQTAHSFEFKWNRRDSYSSPQFTQFYQEWLMHKYGFGDTADVAEHFSRRKRILEIGVGSGLSSFLTAGGDRHQLWVGLDITSAVDLARQRIGGHARAEFVQADLMNHPIRKGSFDTIFCEGVLHHTPSTEQALKTVSELLTDGGELLFYVYRRKAPVREFTDDFVRNLISDLPPPVAWETLRPLTSLAQALAELRVDVVIKEDVPVLGIAAGTYDIQRFIYWHFAKLFWNEKFTPEENHHVNFDWYHPKHAHRQTEEEVLSWCAASRLRITWFDRQASGFTVRAIKD